MTGPELELDGADGGGQLLRTALTLSCLETRAFEMTGIRGDRPTTGLRPQHLACVEAAAALTDATVEGADVDSETLTFAPAHAPRGDVTVDVGTAGSVPLVFDTVAPLGAEIDQPISVTASGGTDVKWAPTLDFLRDVKLPLLGRAGLAAAVRLDRRGFYPTGGGRATLHVAPSTLQPLAIESRGDLVASVQAVAASDLAGADVCERALERVRTRLTVPVAETPSDTSDEPSTRSRPSLVETPSDTSDDPSTRSRPSLVETPSDTSDEPSTRSRPSLVETTATYAETDCPGFALLLSVAGETRAGFDALGEKGVPAEDVADEVVDAFEAWLDGPGAVDEHLADQLVVPLALAGGAVSVPRVTSHLRTNLSLVDTFGYDLQTRTDGADVVVRSA